MAKAARKSKKPAVAMIVFSRSRDIPFNRIRLSDSNVRETDVEAGLAQVFSIQYYEVNVQWFPLRLRSPLLRPTPIISGSVRQSKTRI